MEVKLEFILVIDGGEPITHSRTLENGAPSEVFCADIQNLRCTLNHLMMKSIDENCGGS